MCEREREKKERVTELKVGSRHVTAVDSSRQNVMKISLVKIVLINTCSATTVILLQNSKLNVFVR